MGHRGTGKSTTAAWFYLQGNGILADDVCAIRLDEVGNAVVFPSYPQIKLWQASADLLGISTHQFRRIRPDFDKFGMPLGEQFVDQPLRLAEVVELDLKTEKELPVEGSAKLRLLVEHSYRYGFIRKMGIQNSYHQKLLSLAPQAKMFRSPRVNLAKVPTTV